MHFVTEKPASSLAARRGVVAQHGRLGVDQASRLPAAPVHRCTIFRLLFPNSLAPLTLLLVQGNGGRATQLTMIQRNVSSYDGGARFVGGSVLLMFALCGHAWLAWFGFGAWACSFTGWCPLWWLLRIDTTPWDRADPVGSNPSRGHPALGRTDGPVNLKPSLSPPLSGRRRFPPGDAGD